MKKHKIEKGNKKVAHLINEGPMKKIEASQGDEKDLEVERLINEGLIEMEIGQTVVEVDSRKFVKKKKKFSLEDEPIYFVRS